MVNKNYDVFKSMVDQALSLVKPWDMKMYESCGSLGEYINQMRTIDIRVPRQSGKTQFLLDMFCRENAILVQCPFSEQKFRPDLRKYTTSNPRSFIDQIRGRRDLYKVDYLLIDEPFNRKQDEINDLMVALLICNLLSDKFMVIKLGT